MLVDVLTLAAIYGVCCGVAWGLHLAVGTAKGHGSLIVGNLKRLYDELGTLGFVAWHLTVGVYPSVDDDVIEDPEPNSGILHEQYDADGDPVFFRCSECGHRSQSLGGIHGHIEGHRGYTRFNIPIPFTEESPADYDALMDYTEIVRVEDTAEVSLAEVDGL